MRKNIPAADIIDWVDRQVRAAAREANEPHKSQAAINRLNGRIEAMLQVIDRCNNIKDREE